AAARPAADPATPGASYPDLSQELATERAARVAAEKARDDLAGELALTKKAPAPAAPVHSSVAASVAAARRAWMNGMADQQAPAAPLTPEQATRRLATIGADVDVAIARKDATKAAELLEELSRLGKGGWPEVVKLARAFEEDDEDRDYAF